MISAPYGIGSDIDVFESLEPAVIGLLIAVLVFYLIFFVFAIVSYVLRSVGLHSIAKRRGIHHPWLAWIPIGDAWIVGSISDQYQYVAKAKVRNRRKVLVGLYIAMYALMVAMIVAEVGMIVAIEMNGLEAIAPALTILGIAMAMLVIAVLACVFYYIALYDLFVSCDPGNAVVYLVVGIFFQFLQPIFLFISRKKDLGMPPRKQPQPAVQEIPQVTYESTSTAEAAPAAEEAPEEAPAEMAAEPCTADETDFVEEPTETE